MKNPTVAKKWRTKRIAFASAAAVLFLSAPLHAQRTFSSFTVFGDSFSDTGNLAAVLGAPAAAVPLSPPYALGQFSNGPVWTKQIATMLGLSDDANPALATQAASGNYAVAGARTTGGPTSTESQLAAWSTRQIEGMADENGLYTYFAGANDIIAAAMTPPDAGSAATIAAAERVGAGARTLATAGARFILLPNVVDLGLTPNVRAVPPFSAAVTGLTTLFNQTLASQIAELRMDFAGTTFFDLRLDRLFDNVLRDAALGGSQFGITNTTVPCFPDPPGAPSCDQSLFFDDLHPTTLGHSYVAAAAFDLVAFDRNVPVPEPATWSLALVAAALMFARRRKFVR